MKRRAWCLTAVATGLWGCGGPHDASEKYYLVVGNAKSPYWLEANAGLDRAAGELKVAAKIAGPDAFAPEREVAEFQRVVALKPAGIMVSVSDPKLLTAEIDAAIAAGIPVITVDADAPASKRLTFVGTNNYEAGQMGGRLVAAKLNGKGKVMVFTTLGQANLEQRLQGYRSALATPGIEIAEIVDLKGEGTVAFDKAKDAVKKNLGIDAFVSLEGQSAKEVAEVLKREKVTGKIVMSWDALEPTLELIDQGAVTATIAQKPFTMAYVGLRLLADLRLNKLPRMGVDFDKDPRAPVPRFVDTGSALIDKASLPAFRESQKAAKN